MSIMDVMTTVWAVTRDEYEDQRIIAVFATRELADQFAAKQTVDTSVYKEPVLDRIPEQVTVHVHGAHLHADGRVTPAHNWTQTMWDFEADLGVSEQGMTIQGTWYVQVRQLTEKDAVRLLGDKMAEMLDAQARRQEHNGDWFSRAVTNMWEVLTGTGKPRLTTQQVCYDASFGRVHFSASCRCPR